jgi:hypothetical protein
MPDYRITFWGYAYSFKVKATSERKAMNIISDLLIEKGINEEEITEAYIQEIIE